MVARSVPQCMLMGEKRPAPGTAQSLMQKINKEQFPPGEERERTAAQPASGVSQHNQNSSLRGDGHSSKRDRERLASWRRGHSACRCDCAASGSCRGSAWFCAELDLDLERAKKRAESPAGAASSNPTRGVPQ